MQISQQKYCAEARRRKPNYQNRRHTGLSTVQSMAGALSLGIPVQVPHLEALDLPTAPTSKLEKCCRIRQPNEKRLRTPPQSRNAFSNSPNNACTSSCNPLSQALHCGMHADKHAEPVRKLGSWTSCARSPRLLRSHCDKRYTSCPRPCPWRRSRLCCKRGGHEGAPAHLSFHSRRREDGATSTQRRGSSEKILCADWRVATVLQQTDAVVLVACQKGFPNEYHSCDAQVVQQRPRPLEISEEDIPSTK